MTPAHRRPSARVPLAAPLVIVFAVAGCSSAPSPAPATSTVTVTVTSTVVARPVTAPAVPRTLDIAPFQTRPCDLLTLDQQARLGLPRPSGGAAGHCDWKAINPNHTVTVSVRAGADYFGQVYRQSNDSAGPRWRIFEPVTLGVMQPAVVLSESEDRFDCVVVVATAPKDSMVVQVVAEDSATDSCSGAAEIAGKAIGNLHG